MAHDFELSTVLDHPGHNSHSSGSLFVLDQETLLFKAIREVLQNYSPIKSFVVTYHSMEKEALLIRIRTELATVEQGVADASLQV